MKKKIGSFIAILVFLIILVSGYYLGRYVFSLSEDKMSIVNIFRIDVDSKSSDIIYSFDKIYSIEDMCSTSTGKCTKDLGSIKLNDVKVKFKIEYDFDTYTGLVHLGKKTINVSNLNSLYVVDNNYLILSFDDLNGDYLIKGYDYLGNLSGEYDGYYDEKGLFLEDGLLYFLSCDKEDVNEEGKRSLITYSIGGLSDLSINEVSNEYEC